MRTATQFGAAMLFARTEERVGRWVARLAEGAALLGGVTLVLLALMTCVSIIGRWINTGPIRGIQGDYELIEIGTALAIFAFLPYCQLRRGHVTVDILVRAFPAGLQRVLAVLEDAVVAAAAALILWRLYLGFGEKFPFLPDAWRDALAMGFKPFFPETTYEWQIPIWVPFGMAVVLCALFLVTSLYTVWRSLNRVRA